MKYATYFESYKRNDNLRNMSVTVNKGDCIVQVDG